MRSASAVTVFVAPHKAAHPMRVPIHMPLFGVKRGQALLLSLRAKRAELSH